MAKQIIDQDAVRELNLHVWNNRECMKSIESLIECLCKKDVTTLSQKHLESSRVISRITTQAISTYNHNYGAISLDSASRKEFYKVLSAEILERVPEYKNN